VSHEKHVTPQIKVPKAEGAWSQQYQQGDQREHCAFVVECGPLSQMATILFSQLCSIFSSLSVCLSVCHIFLLYNYSESTQTVSVVTLGWSEWAVVTVEGHNQSS
ncbi:hypothetical protein STEG23_007190, partial [Scotinomys teguina]